ncbi:hypothetical protein IB244_26375 [Rhizobium sp. RHZ02]|uniref:helix-turn-helix domain-containing protein n=1 Tax=Rhizobium sp. RHZ02 TaxID=2769306 RepID=UPI00177FB266|nr:hypothetical protein [Rhizobium sp. RHZ02]
MPALPLHFPRLRASDSLHNQDRSYLPDGSVIPPQPHGAFFLSFNSKEKAVSHRPNIRTVHRRTGGNISRTAHDLGLSRTTVYKHVR